MEADEAFDMLYELLISQLNEIETQDELFNFAGVTNQRATEAIRDGNSTLSMFFSMIINEYFHLSLKHKDPVIVSAKLAKHLEAQRIDMPEHVAKFRKERVN